MPPEELTLEDAPRRRVDVTQVVQDGEASIYRPDGREIRG
jgi:hypothetical protein